MRGVVVGCDVAGGDRLEQGDEVVDLTVAKDEFGRSSSSKARASTIMLFDGHRQWVVNLS